MSSTIKSASSSSLPPAMERLPNAVVTDSVVGFGLVVVVVAADDVACADDGARVDDGACDRHDDDEGGAWVTLSTTAVVSD